MRTVCPRDAGHERFSTAAHVMEHWIVDRAGNFLEVDSAETSQTTHGPDIGNIWICVECGAEAKVING